MDRRGENEMARHIEGTSGSSSSAGHAESNGSDGSNGSFGAPHRGLGAPALTVVVPTRNEAGNVEALVERLESALPALPMEIIFVDDSDDETPAVIERVRAQSRRRIVLLHRKAEERVDGLGGAVLHGLRAARAPWVCVMDGDLQHPPEVLAEMLKRAKAGDVDIVMASRFCERGEAATGFGRVRAGLSAGSKAAAKALFPFRLRAVTDPMSGFFLVRRGSLEISKLQPHGFKILLEILVRTPGLRRAEVGFTFGERHAGESKASLGEGLTYLSHLTRLRAGDMFVRMTRFGVVGAIGLGVNMIAFAKIGRAHV